MAYGRPRTQPAGEIKQPDVVTQELMLRWGGSSSTCKTGVVSRESLRGYEPHLSRLSRSERLCYTRASASR